MTDATWALVGVTIILVIVTGWYATETRRTVKRMDQEREQLSRPFLTFQLIPWQPQLVKLRIQNVGNGPAFRVKGTIEAIRKSGSASIPWSYPLLAAEKYEEFGFPAPPEANNEERFRLDEIRSKVIEVRAKFTYSSASGSKYELNETVQVQQVTDDWLASKMMATQDHPERILPRIAKAIEDLARKSTIRGV